VAPPIPLLRAATAFYLLLPIGFFAYGWLRPAYALPALLLVALFLLAAAHAVAQATAAGWRTLTARPGALRQALAGIAPAALLLLVWLLLSGAGGQGYQNDDYHASNALFKALIQGHWPLTFQLDGQPAWVVYYLAYYLPAAAVGKFFGWQAANGALWLWTAAGCGLAFAWFVALSRVALQGRPGRLLLLAVLFCLFGGWDFVAASVLQGALPAATAHTEFWAGFFQYSSNATLLYWVPQQALAAWLMTGLVLDALYHPHDLRYLGLSLAAGLLWSPLALIGLLPCLALLAGVYAMRGRWQALLQPAAIFAHVCALGLAVLLGLYLTANRYHFPNGWVWQGVDNRALLARYYLAFWWVEFGGLAVCLVLCLALAARQLPNRPLSLRAVGWRERLQQRFGLEPRHLAVLAVSLATLTLLPLYRLGFNNDLAMRASIPSLFVLWLFTSQVILGTQPGFAPQPPFRPLRLVYGLLVCVVVVGFLPGLAEVTRSVRYYHFGPPPLEAVAAIADADRRTLVEQRVGDGAAFFFRYLAEK
jgi:hypothetical protein